MSTETHREGLATAEFFDSVRTGRLQRLRRYIDEDPGLLRAVDSNGESAVMEALYYGQPGALDILLEHRSDLDIFEASALGRAGRVRDLLNADPQLVNTMAPDGYTPLHLAAFFGRTDVVRALLERGASPNKVSENTRRLTPLHAAASRGHLEAARLLLDAGPDPNARDLNSETPLHLAARNHDDSMVDLLLMHSADPNIRNSAGDTPAEVVTAPSYGESE